MKYLVDANVLSEATRRHPDPKVLSWLELEQAEIAIDPVILGELRFGILLLPRGRKRRRLERWFDAGVDRLRCLSWEPEIGLRWAQLLADLRRQGSAIPVKDSLIAATALTHSLSIVTRNERDFERAGVEVLNPFEL